MRAIRGWLAVGVCAMGLLLTGCDDEDNGGGGGGGDARDLVGIWQWNVSNPIGGPTEGELILWDNGRFSQTIVWNGLMTYDAGLYESSDGFIHFAVQEHEPQEYLGEPMSWPASFSYFYTFVTDDHIILEDRLVDTQWDAYRE